MHPLDPGKRVDLRIHGFGKPDAHGLLRAHAALPTQATRWRRDGAAASRSLSQGLHPAFKDGDEFGL